MSPHEFYLCRYKAELLNAHLSSNYLRKLAEYCPDSSFFILFRLALLGTLDNAWTERNLCQQGQLILMCQELAAPLAEDFDPLPTIRAFEEAHIFDDTEYWSACRLEHFDKNPS